MKRVGILAVVPLMAFGVALSGCGSSGSSNARDPGSKLTGSPYIVDFINTGKTPGLTNPPEIYPAIQAEVDTVNASGGINGHPLKATQCADNGDENQARTCARNAVSDPHVIAVVNKYSTFGEVIDPILEQGKIASVGGYPFAPIDMNSPIEFPTTGGATAGVACSLSLAVDQLHTNQVALAVHGGDQGSIISNLANSVLKNRYGFGLARTTFIPANTPDLNPTVAAATRGGIKAVVPASGAADVIRFVQIAHQLGSSAQIVSTYESWTPDNFKALGSIASNIPMESDIPPVSSNVPGMVAFRASMGKYASNDAQDYSSVLGWLAVKMVADVAKTLPTVSAASLLNAMSHLQGYDSGGIIPPYTTTTPSTALGGIATHLYNPTCLYGKLVNNKFTLDSNQRHNPFTKAQS